MKEEEKFCFNNFFIITDASGERITGTYYFSKGKRDIYINNRKEKNYYKNIRKMIESNDKIFALLNCKSESEILKDLSQFILFSNKYSIKYIDFFKTPTEIKYRNYNGKMFS